MTVMFEKLRWTTDDECQVCASKLPEGATGYIGTAPGLHVVVVAWDDRADGAVTHMLEGRVVRMLPDEALRAAAFARAAIAERRAAMLAAAAKADA